MDLQLLRIVDSFAVAAEPRAVPGENDLGTLEVRQKEKQQQDGQIQWEQVDHKDQACHEEEVVVVVHMGRVLGDQEDRGDR